MLIAAHSARSHPMLNKMARFDDLAKCHVCGAIMHNSHMTRRGDNLECPDHG